MVIKIRNLMIIVSASEHCCACLPASQFHLEVTGDEGPLVLRKGGQV